MKTFKKNLYPLLALAIPLVITGLIQSSVFFFQTLFIAHLGQEALAAGALVSWLFGTLFVILFGTLSSINVLVAHKHGANDEHSISLIVRDGLWLAILLSIPAFLLFWNIAPLLAFAGQNQAIVQLATSYLHAMAWGLLPSFVMIALLEIMIGLGRTRHILFFNIISVTLNIFVSFALVFGKFGLPALGIDGAGWGMTISDWITATLLGATVLVKREYKPYFRHLMTPAQPSYLIELLRIGLPMGAMYCVEVAFFLTLTLLMGSFGSQFLAANQITLQYIGLFTAVIFSIAQAITVRMGHLFGAGEIRASITASYMGIYLAMAFMMIVAIAYFFFPESLISIDINTHDPENSNLIYHAKQFLMIGALFQIVEAIRISLFGALRGLKDTHFTLLISILSFWGISLPVGYLLATYFHFAGAGLWWGMVLGSTIGIILLSYRLKSKIKDYQCVEI
jgi:MATE family multidrug resistance protein